MIMALILILRLHFIHEPFDRDEGFYSYIGQEILRGAIPYRDVIDVKPPGINYIYAFILVLFGQTSDAVRLFTAFYSIVTVYMVYRLTHSIDCNSAGLIAAFCFGIFSSGPIIQGNSSNSEVYMLLPLTASAYLFLRAVDTRRRIYIAGSGICAGMAMLIKTVALPNLLLILLFIIFLRGRDWTVKKVIADILTFLMPSLLLALAVMAYFAYNGAFNDFFYWNVTYAKTLAQTHNVFERMTGNLRLVGAEHILLWAAGLPTFLWLILKKRDIKSLFIAAFLPASFAGLSLPGWFFAHYFIQILPSLSILAGIGLANIFERKKRLGFIAAPLIVASLVTTIKVDAPYYLAPSPEAVSTMKYKSDIFVNDVKVAAYIKARTKPEDYVFQWGWEPGINFYSGRRSPNRFTCMMFVAGDSEPQKAVYELMNSLIIKKPVYIIIQDGREKWAGYSDIKAVLNYYYLPETVIGGMSIYHIKGSAS